MPDVMDIYNMPFYNMRMRGGKPRLLPRPRGGVTGERTAAPAGSIETS